MKTQLIQNIWSLALASAVSVALLAGCEKTDYPAAQPSTTGFLTTARALIVNASNATGVTALIENTAAGSTLAPGANTGYVSAPVSVNQIRIQGAGGTLGTTDLASKTTFAANTNYTIFVTDSISRARIVNMTTGALTDAGGIRFVTVTDTLTAPAAGTAKVRFFDFSPNVSGVSSSTTAGSASARLISSTGTAAATLNGRAYRAVAAASLVYTRVPAGMYTVQLYAATTVPAALTAPTAASKVLTLADGKIYTIYAYGLKYKSVLDQSALNIGVVQHN